MSPRTFRHASLLKSIRHRHKLKQSDLAEVAKVSQATISLVEQGKQPLTNEALDRIAKRFKLKDDDLSDVPIESLYDHSAWYEYDRAVKHLRQVTSTTTKLLAFIRRYYAILDRALGAPHMEHLPEGSGAALFTLAESIGNNRSAKTDDAIKRDYEKQRSIAKTLTAIETSIREDRSQLEEWADTEFVNSINKYDLPVRRDHVLYKSFLETVTVARSPSSLIGELLGVASQMPSDEIQILIDLGMKLRRRSTHNAVDEYLVEDREG